MLKINLTDNEQIILTSLLVEFKEALSEQLQIEVFTSDTENLLKSMLMLQCIEEIINKLEHLKEA